MIQNEIPRKVHFHVKFMTRWVPKPARGFVSQLFVQLKVFRQWFTIRKRPNAWVGLDYLQQNALPTRFSSLKSIRENQIWYCKKTFAAALSFQSLRTARGEHFTQKYQRRKSESHAIYTLWRHVFFVATHRLSAKLELGKIIEWLSLSNANRDKRTMKIPCHISSLCVCAHYCFECKK